MPEIPKGRLVKLRTILIGIWMAVWLSAGADWAPIPAEVWAIKDGPKGAVVLEERIRFKVREMESTYRVRIFSESGRNAAALPDLPKAAYDIKGRTVYPDGREITFDSRKDFAERKVEAGGRESSQVHMVAPGVTADCVVEVRWRERCDGYRDALPRRFTNGLYGQWRLGNAYPTRVSAVEISERMPLATSINGNSQWKVEAKTIDGFRVFIYRDLPAVEVPPYSLQVTNGLPRLEIYWQPDPLIQAFSEGRDAYWTEAFKRIYLPDYEDSVDTGRPFKQVAAELIEGLPEPPHARATELLRRLDARIKNMSHPTAEERAALPKKFWDDYESNRLDKVAASGLASSHGMRLMFYHLLKTAGIQPKIAKVVDRDQDLFNYGRLNPWQFHHDLLGVEEAGKGVIWFDAGNRHATPGVVHPDYEGVGMLVFQTKDSKSWKPSLELLGAKPFTSNRRSYAFSLHLEDDSDRFDLQAQFGGYPEYAERYRYLPLEPKEQSRVLKEQFEKNRKSLTISRAEVKDATVPFRPVSWVISGSLERESGRRREVEPFPGMTWPLWVPDQLDATRTTSIVLPYLFTHAAVSSFEVPKGYRFDPPAELFHQNEFGTVLWASDYDPQTRKVTVRLDAHVVSLNLGASHWSAFREFLGWIQEACQRTVVLAKEG